MTDDVRGDLADALAGADETIARQQDEIEALRDRIVDQTFAGNLRELLKVAIAAGTLSSPVSHSELLRMIVETAADVIDAESAVLLLLDKEGDELVFDVTLGVDAEEVKGLRVPLGHGIAGLVAASGQPMAVSDAGGDPRVAPEIAESLSYVPQSILCVPLSYDDRIIGVLEVVDKDGDSSFTEHDVETLGLFAKLAAVAIRQSRAHHSLGALLGEVLDSLGDGDGVHEEIRNGATAFAARVEEDPAYGRARELTELVHELSQYGEDELGACQEMLRGFADYLRTRSRSGEAGAHR